MRETPDIETSSNDYAKRFSGDAGAFFLECQKAAVMNLLAAPFGTTILDVGGGHGQLTPFLAEAGYEVTVAGSSNACYSRLTARSYGSRVNYVTSDLLNLPFADQSFDLVISVRLISHIQSWPFLIEEFCRVARNAVIIDYPSTVGMNALTPLLFGLKKHIEKNTRTYSSFSRSELAREFDKNAFDITNTRAQFFLPMVVHRALGGPRYLQFLESMFAKIRLTQAFGSPVLLRADRKRT